VNDLPLDVLTDEQLNRAHRRIVRTGNIALVATFAMLILAVWVDPRWWVMALISVVICFMAGYGGRQARAEITRRKETP
jgi:hypothetical protein